ncbi:MAG: TolB family protein [Thermoplasmatota archaeon]
MSHRATLVVVILVAPSLLLLAQPAAAQSPEGIPGSIPGVGGDLPTPWLTPYGNAIWFGNLSKVGPFSSSLNDLHASGDYVVWVDHGHVVLFDIRNGVSTNLTSGRNATTNPLIEAGRVVYEAQTARGSQLWVYNITTGNATRIADSSAILVPEALDGSWLAWTETSSGMSKLQAMNLDSGLNLSVTLSPNEKRNPVLFGHGFIAWEEYAYDEWDVAVRHLPDGPIHFVTHNRHLKFGMATNGSDLYYDQDIGSDIQSVVLFRYDPERQTTTSLGSIGATRDNFEFLSGNLEIWWTSTIGQGNEMLILNESNGVSNILAGGFTMTQPTTSGSTVYLAEPDPQNAKHTFLLMGQPSPFATARIPTISIDAPLDGALVYTQTSAFGNYTTTPGWPQPTAFEWRVYSTSSIQPPNWTVMSPSRHWSVGFNPFSAAINLPQGQAYFQIRVLYGVAPSIWQSSTVNVQMVQLAHYQFPSHVDNSLLAIAVKNPGMVLFVILLVILILLLLTRALQRRTRQQYVVEYVRQSP